MNNNRLLDDFTFSIEDPYFKEVISQIPRLLSMMDRNPSSKSYGSFDRTYWLDKAIDFPSANIQFSALALAYIYKYNFDGSQYFKNKNLLSWIEASMLFWAKIQKRDGSFDEFYPNERGWGAPTGFTCYAMGICYNLLKTDLSKVSNDVIKKSLYKCVMFLNNYDGDKMLANHHAISILAINTVWKITGDNSLLKDMDNKIRILNNMHDKDGWSKEYDGPDLGYLTATVSFLSKSQLINFNPIIQDIINDSIKFISYFAQPDGGFGGLISSRNTVHVYPDGFELTKNKNKISSALANHFTKTISMGNTALPSRMADRYLGYRLVEFIETSMSKNIIPDIKDNCLLPFQKNNFTKIFKSSGYLVKKINNNYIILNMAKGGALKILDIENKNILLSDAGITAISKIESYTSSWIDPDYNIIINEDEYIISGKLLKIISPYQFTSGMIIFRLIQLTLGRISVFAYYFKILIKKVFISGIKKSNINFKRKINISKNNLIIEDFIQSNKKYSLQKLIIGGDFHFRYVPQSRYFLENEISSKHTIVKKDDLKNIFKKFGFLYKRKYDLS